VLKKNKIKTKKRNVKKYQRQVFDTIHFWKTILLIKVCVVKYKTVRAIIMALLS
jgi:hypothetical protein